MGMNVEIGDVSVHGAYYSRGWDRLQSRACGYVTEIIRRTPDGRIVGFAVFNFSKHDRQQMMLPLAVTAIAA